MTRDSNLSPTRSNSLLTLAVCIVLALLIGAVFALGGLPMLIASLILAIVTAFATISARLPMEVLGAAIFCLALSPFNFGIQTGIVPKLFGDEMLLILYLAVFPLLYVVTSRTWRAGCTPLYMTLAVFLLTEAAPFLAFGKDLIASRNLIETSLLGALLCTLTLQEVANSNKEEIIPSCVKWLTILLAALSITERVAQRNPIMENTTDILYLSPLIARITEGVYRPYVTFFHPSETGTFMALGAPFVLRGWLQRQSLASYLGLAIVAAGIFVNATRGVWVGVAVAIILLVPRAWLFVSAFVPVSVFAGTIVYSLFKNTPFMQRLTDSNNLLSRFEYWKIALSAFADHPLVGVGHMQFPNIYLNYVQDLSNTAHFDIAKISVVDNAYLTTLVEHGLLGLTSLIALLLFFSVFLGKYSKKLGDVGLPRQSSLVRSCQAAVVIYSGAGLFADINQFTKVTKYLFIIVGIGLGVGVRYAGSMTEVWMADAETDSAWSLQNGRQ